MRKTLLFLLSGLIPAIMCSQTLTQANAGYSIGEVYTTYSCDSTTVNWNNSGTGAIWNFPGATTTGTGNTSTMVSPSSTPYFSSFPSANMAAQGASNSYYYYVCNSSGLTFLGYSTQTSSMIYNNPETILQFPTSYGSTFNDYMYCDYTVSTIAMHREAQITSLADATGTLTINGHTFNNTIRVKHIQQINDSCIYYTSHQTVTTYWWFDCVHKMPPLSISYAAITTGGNTTYSKTATLADFASNIDFEFYSDKFDVDVFPNPLVKGNDLTVQIINDNYLNSLNYNITDISGRVVLKGETEPGAMDLNINTEPLNSGVYFLNVSSDNGTVVRKFVVE